MKYEVRVLIEADAEVGEGPVIDPRTGNLCWVDIPAGHLFQSDLATGATERWDLGMSIGALAPRANHEGFGVAVAQGFGFGIDGELTVVDEVLPDADMRMNDAKCDPAGRLWAGSTEMDLTPGRGSLHRWDGRGPSTVMRTGLGLPNGLGWNAKGDVMYLADSVTGLIMRTGFDVARGEIGEFTPIAKVSQGVPDGLAVDQEGCLWVAIWGASAVHRYSPIGRLIDTISMPVTQPSSCAFTSDGKLIVTSARAGLRVAVLRQEPLAGSVFEMATQTEGVPIAPFAT